MPTPYGYTKKLSISFDEALDRTRKKLSEEGFGIITEINAKETFKKKLDKDFDNYIILGACQPKTAYEALSAEKEMGLLLPCNVIVYEDDGNTFVSAIRPTIAMKELEGDTIKSLAHEIEGKLIKVIDSI